MTRRPPSRADDIRSLQLLVREAERACGFVTGRHRDDLDSDDLLRYAVVKAVENVGEEASRVSPDATVLAPEVPWANMTGMRHRLAHAYDEVDLDILWAVVTVDVPAVLPALRRQLTDLEEGEGNA